MVSNDGFTVNVNTWKDSTLYTGGCSWMEIPGVYKDLQYGSFSTEEDHPWYKPQKQTARKITFPQPFTKPPKIVVWLSHVDMGQKANWRVKTYVSGITSEFFNLHLDTWSDTVLYAAEAWWVAYPEDSPNFNSGVFTTLSDQPLAKGWSVTDGTVPFKLNLGNNPKLMAALNWFDADCSGILRVALNTAIRDNKHGFDWAIKTWEEQLLYGAGASWIAWN